MVVFAGSNPARCSAVLGDTWTQRPHLCHGCLVIVPYGRRRGILTNAATVVTALGVDRIRVGVFGEYVFIPIFFSLNTPE